MPLSASRFLLALLACLAWGASAAPADELARCRLPEKSKHTDIGLGFPRKANRLPTIGEIHLTVLFVDFPDVPAAMSPEQAFSIISPLAEAFYARNSYGKLKLVLDPHPHWTRMSKGSADYRFHRGADFLTHRAYLQEAITLTPEADFSRADGVLAIANPAVRAIDYGPAFTAPPGFGVLAGGREILNGATSGGDLMSWGWTWFDHEIGHAMGLPDLAGPAPENGDWNTYVGDFSLMGSPSGAGRDYLGWERWLLKWIEDSQVICAGEASLNAALSPIEEAGGSKIVVAPVGESRAVVVESRRAEWFDERLPGPGLLVYLVDTALNSHQGAVRIAPHSADETHYFSALLTEGRSIEVEGVKVTALGGDRLHLERVTPPPRTADSSPDPATVATRR